MHPGAHLGAGEAAGLQQIVLGLNEVFSITKRSPVRIALGAQPQSVKRWITAQIVRKVALGCLVGLLGALLSTRLVRDLLYGVSPTDPFVLGATCVLLITGALPAAWIPARRAASIDPMQTLRAE